MSLEKKLANISTKCSSHHQAESEKTANKRCYYSHTLLRIHIIGGQRSVKISPPFLLHHSGSATRDFQSSISVEALLREYHLDGQGLHQQLLSSAMAQYSCLLHGRWTMAEDRSCLWRRPCTSWWYPQRSILTDMEDYKFLVVGSLWWGGREGGAILTNLWSPIMCILSSIWL